MNSKDPIFKILNYSRGDTKIWDFLNKIRLCEIISPFELAKRDGLKVTAVALPVPREAEIFCDSFSAALIAQWDAIITEYKEKQTPEYNIIQCNNLKICYISSWDRFELFSSSYDCIIEDSVRLWLKHLEGKLIYKTLTSDGSAVVIDFNGLLDFRVKSKSVFIGSNQNWGHWLTDCLPQIALASALPNAEDISYVFGKMDENQTKCLELLGIKEDQVINLENASQDESFVKFFNFDDIMILPAVSKASGLAYLQNHFSGLLTRKSSCAERVFISRRNDFPRHRIANLDEIERTFSDNGFTIINDLKTKPLLEQIEIFQNAKIVAFVSGAEYGNLAFVSPKAIIIILISAYFINIKNNYDLIKVQLIPYIFGSGLKIVLVSGNPIDASDSSTYALCHYDFKNVKSMIDLAKELS
jgi:hypothetical protein